MRETRLRLAFVLLSAAVAAVAAAGGCGGCAPLFQEGEAFFVPAGEAAP